MITRRMRSSDGLSSAVLSSSSSSPSSCRARKADGAARGGEGGGFVVVVVVMIMTMVVVQLFLIQGCDAQWTELTFPNNEVRPSARVFAASNAGAGLSGGAPVPPPWDPISRTGLVVFGGAGDPETLSPVFNDLWILNPQDGHPDGRAWTQIETPGQMPEPRCLAAVAVEPETGVMYLFGGFNGTNWFNDMWKIDLASVIHYPGSTGSWFLVVPNSPGELSWFISSIFIALFPFISSIFARLEHSSSSVSTINVHTTMNESYCFCTADVNDRSC